MSEKTKDRILARYFILAACGVKISPEFQGVVDKIKHERAAASVVRYAGAGA